MKTAEEWVKELHRVANCEIAANDLISQIKVIKTRQFETVKQIQLDAWKQGMSDAAEIAGKDTCDRYPVCGSTACSRNEEIKRLILTARDKKDSI